MVRNEAEGSLKGTESWFAGHGLNTSCSCSTALISDYVDFTATQGQNSVFRIDTLVFAGLIGSLTLADVPV